MKNLKENYEVDYIKSLYSSTPISKAINLFFENIEKHIKTGEEKDENYTDFQPLLGIATNDGKINVLEGVEKFFESERKKDLLAILMRGMKEGLEKEGKEVEAVVHFSEAFLGVVDKKEMSEEESKEALKQIREKGVRNFLKRKEAYIMTIEDKEKDITIIVVKEKNKNGEIVLLEPETRLSMKEDKSSKSGGRFTFFN